MPSTSSTLAGTRTPPQALQHAALQRAHSFADRFTGVPLEGGTPLAAPIALTPQALRAEQANNCIFASYDQGWRALRCVLRCLGYAEIEGTTDRPPPPALFCRASLRRLARTSARVASARLCAHTPHTTARARIAHAPTSFLEITMTEVARLLQRAADPSAHPLPPRPEAGRIASRT